MAGNAKKTEHAGPKKGRGAYWGRKAEAKRESNRKSVSNYFANHFQDTY
jgi:hypothetical protein